MSFNGSGLFVINTAGQPVVAGTTISSTVFNALTADLATGLSNCITKDGQTTVTQNIPMNSHKLTGLAAGSNNGDSIRWEQISAIATWAATPSSANLAAVVADETGSGALVFGTKPTITGLTVSAPSTGILLSVGSGARFTSAADAQAWMASNGWGFDLSGAWTRTASTKAVMWGTGNNAGYFEVWSTATADATTTAPSDTNRKFAITDDGRMFGTALHNNAGAVTGTTNQYVASKTYTPTVTATSNVASSTARVARVIRVGNVVEVSGELDVQTTANAGWNCEISLPIASNIANAYEVSGTLSNSFGNLFGQVRGSVANDTATFVMNGTQSNAAPFSFSYKLAYEVL